MPPGRVAGRDQRAISGEGQHIDRVDLAAIGAHVLLCFEVERADRTVIGAGEQPAAWQLGARARMSAPAADHPHVVRREIDEPEIPRYGPE
jgi:hypothetical protein